MTKYLGRGEKRLRALLASTVLVSVVGYGASVVAQTASGITSDSFKTQEYLRSTGLDEIKAAEAYSIIANGRGRNVDGYIITGVQGGEGVTIAVVDIGFDEDHPDLAPNLIDSITFGAPDRDSQHGTAVAGIAAGASDGRGIQGVAYNAGILAYQSGSWDLTAQSILDASARSASIINMSLGDDLGGPLETSDGSQVFVEANVIGGQVAVAGGLRNAPLLNAGEQRTVAAIETAVGSGSLVVIAAGNERGSLPILEDRLGLPRGTFVELGPDNPAYAAGTAAASRDGVIVVVSVDKNSQRSEFTHGCLGVEARCLAAPGENFQGAVPGGRVDNIGQGTSYSAPLVSGAAAVVQAAFGVTPHEAGNRLLSTATPLGPAKIYGQGLLNLANALSPQGQLTLATSSSVDGPKVALGGTALSLGSSLALNGAGVGLLTKAVTLDDDNFPFAVDLSRSAQVQSRTTGLETFIGSVPLKTATIATGSGTMTLSLAEDGELDDPYRAEFAASETALKEEATPPRMQMQSELVEGVDLFFGFNGPSSTEAGLVQSLPTGGDFFQPSAFLAPFDQLSGEQTGGGMTVDLGANTGLTVSAFASTDDHAARQSVMQKVELAHKAVGDIELRLGFGFVQEDGGFLGSETKGAFGAKSGSQSQYLDISVLAPLSERISLFGAYSLGDTNAASGGASLLSDYSAIRSEAFGAGLVMTDVAEKGDGLSIMVGQPLRVTKGSAEVTVPVGRTADGTVVQEEATLELSPEGREIAFEAVYNFALDEDDQSFSAGSFVRLNPDHDPNADPDVGVGLSYKIKF